MIDIGINSVRVRPEQSIAPIANLSIESLSDGTLQINTLDSSEISLTITGSSFHDGTYILDPAALSAGPVGLVAPTIVGDPMVGDVLTATPGLFVYDTDAGNLTETFVWQRDTTSVQDASNSTYEILPIDAGQNFRLVHSVGSLVVASESVSVPFSGVIFNEIFDAYNDEAILQDHPDWVLSYAAGGTLVVRDNKAVAFDQSAVGIVVPVLPSLSDDHFVEIDIANTGFGNGAIIEIYVRYTDRFNGYSARVQNGTGYLNRYLSGAATIISTNNFNVSDNDIIRFEIMADTLSLYQNGSILMTIQDSNISSGTTAMKIRTINTAPPNAPAVERFTCGDL